MNVGRPRRGRAVVSLVEQGEFTTEGGLIVDHAEDEFVQRVRIEKLGEPVYRDGFPVPWDFKEGDEVLVPFHAGRHHQWFDRRGRLHDLWIVAEAEIIHVFDTSPADKEPAREEAAWNS